MTTTEAGFSGEIFVVDDDSDSRAAFGVLFEQAGFAVSLFSDGAGLIQGLVKRQPALVLIDIGRPGPGRLDVLRLVASRQFTGPVVITSAHADIPMAVEAIKAGASDVVERPCDPARLVAQVRCVLDGHARRRTERADPVSALGPEGVSLLTPRERDVLHQLVRGASNKEAGRSLGISPRTIEVHRARIMEKLGAKNAADLVRVIYDDRRSAAG